jgi:adenine-specific DNA-methyltransferase
LSNFKQIFTIEDEHTQNYIKERFKSEFNGKKYMVAPIERNAKLGLRETLRYEYKGYKPKYGWMMSEENLIKMDMSDRLHWNSNGNPVRRVFLEDYQGQPVSNLWSDIYVINPMSKERTEFDGGQKPEALIQRILEFSTNEGDTILDIFGGSGSTFATAHKMKRKWVGVEIGNHAETLIMPRLKTIIQGKDDGGITKAVNWHGGGSFKYYHLGDSIINVDKETGKGEFNWKLGKSFIQESLLVSYDFIVQNDINVFPAQFFKDDNNPTIGKIIGKNGKSIYGIAFLVAPGEIALTITNEEIKTIYNVIRKQEDFQSLVIYTNKGIDIAQEAIPENLDIIKVPHAIFAELER